MSSIEGEIIVNRADRYLMKEGFVYSFAKYFVHGILIERLFSLTLIGLLLVDPGITGLVGFIIILGGLYLVMGIINMVIGRVLWQLSVRRNFSAAIIHGLVLWLLLLISFVPLTSDILLIQTGLMELPVDSFLRSPLYLTLLQIAYVFWSGYVSTTMARWFRNPVFDSPRRRYKDAQDSVRGECPTCNALYLYPPSSVRPSGNVECPNCGEVFYLPRREYTIMPTQDEGLEEGEHELDGGLE